MANRSSPVHQTAMPLVRRINEGKFTKSAVAKKLNVLPQHITNWLRRGVPAARLPDVAALCDLSTDEYRLESGLLSKHAKPRQGKLAVVAAIRDLEALPDGLQVYVARKASELRVLYEELPAWLRDKLVPPEDAQQYRNWERDIEALMTKFRRPDGGEL